MRYPEKKNIWVIWINLNLRKTWNESKNPKSSFNKSLHDYVEVKKHSE